MATAIRPAAHYTKTREAPRGRAHLTAFKLGIVSLS